MSQLSIKKGARERAPSIFVQSMKINRPNNFLMLFIYKGIILLIVKILCIAPLRLNQQPH